MKIKKLDNDIQLLKASLSKKGLSKQKMDSLNERLTKATDDKKKAIKVIKNAITGTLTLLGGGQLLSFLNKFIK